MIIYLRDKNDKNYYEVEFFQKDKYIELYANVYSINCFKYILERQEDKKYIDKFIKSFEFLEELRGWYYETYLQENKNPTYSDVLAILRIMLSSYAHELGFCIVED